MRLSSLGVRNVARNRFRTALTVLGVAVAIIAFLMLRTVLSSWTAAADYAAKDRVVTRHKVSFIMPLPRKYVDDIARQPGVKDTLLASWFGGKDPRHEQEFFGTIAVDPRAFVRVYDEVKVEPAQLEAWQQERRGAIVGDALAKKLGYKVGDRVTLRGTIYPGDWPFLIKGIYTTTRQSMDRSSLFFHYDYLNEWLKQNNPRGADQVGWVVSRIEPGQRPADVAKRLDAAFEVRDVQTTSQDERSFNTSFLGMITAVLKAVDVVSIVILLIMMLILGNTIAMGVRERTHEYGVLRAIGFRPKHLVLFVVGEASTLGVVGGALGVALAYPLVEKGMGRFLEENMGAFFPYFRIDPATAVLALALASLLGAGAALIPALRVAKLDVVNSLRKVG
ncbi:MAG: ABC transporter permease [Polyangiaceae bacterium]|nr:ABC transporter permease [Polyangiaceae bacterium]